MQYRIETRRLWLRELTEEDVDALQSILGDPQTMYAWEHGFDRAETVRWVETNRERYRTDGFSYFAAVRKEDGRLVGAAGPLMERYEGHTEVGIAYIIGREYWRCGYGSEAARASLDYAFRELGVQKVIAEIRPENTASRRVAERLGMKEEGRFVKQYRGKAMPHLIYAAYHPYGEAGK